MEVGKYRKAKQPRRRAEREEVPDELALGFFEETQGLVEDLVGSGMLEEAEAMSRELVASLEYAIRKGGEDRTLHEQMLARELFVLGGILADRPKLREAATVYRRVVAECERLHGEKHVGTTAAKNNLATVLQELGDYDRAEALYRGILDHVHGAERLSVLGNLADLLRERGSADAGRRLLDRHLRARDYPACPPAIRLKLAAQTALLDPSPAERTRRLALAVSQLRGTLGDASPLARKYSRILDDRLGRSSPARTSPSSGAAAA